MEGPWDVNKFVYLAVACSTYVGMAIARKSLISVRIKGKRR